jgi:hypothetical protein
MGVNLMKVNKYYTLENCPLVLGNVLDADGLLLKTYAMEIEEIPFFILKNLNAPKLLVLNPNYVIEVEVTKGEISRCRDEDYLIDLENYLLSMQTVEGQLREFKPLCEG